jgi:hypothetical protein
MDLSTRRRPRPLFVRSVQAEEARESRVEVLAAPELAATWRQVGTGGARQVSRSPRLRPDVDGAICAYLVAGGSIPPDDELGEALIVADGNFARASSLSRRGVRHVVDNYLRVANVKRRQACPRYLEFEVEIRVLQQRLAASGLCVTQLEELPPGAR